MTDILDGLDRAVDIADAVRAGRLSAVAVTAATLERIDARNPALNAFVHVDPDGALRAAGELDRRVRAGEDPGALAGVPFGVKDVEDCAGMPTTNASLLYMDRPPVRHDSIAVARLRAAGAIPVGKTATPEFGAGGSTFSRAFGVTRNPWNPKLTPSGSSGGSSAAVSSGMVQLATASDGGGSIRGPAAFCSLVGLKPSYGRIPATPVRSVSTTGAIVSSVRDAARHLDVVKGPDDRDWSSLPADPRSYEDALERVDLSGSRAFWSELGYPRADEETYALARAAAEALASFAGIPLDTEGWSLTAPIEAIVCSAAATVDSWMSLDEETWLERRRDVGADVRHGMENALRRSAPELARYHQRRVEIAREVAELFATHDFLLTPSSSIPAFDAALPLDDATFDGAELPFGPDPQLLLASLCGNPAISAPAGITRSGLPVGLQIIGRRHQDLEVLAAARGLERAKPWPRYPPVHA